jgi:hypothetical protein
MTKPSFGADLIGLMGEGPAPDAVAAKQLALYGQFVGDWLFENEYYREGGEVERSSGEWHFAWALEGRAIVDLWTYPGRAQRAATGEAAGGLGLTVRTFDPKTSAWNIAWSAANWRFLLLVGRRIGDEIIQSGEEGGESLRWVFSEIGSESFLWRAEASRDQGRNWRLTQIMRVRRAKEPEPGR